MLSVAHRPRDWGEGISLGLVEGMLDHLPGVPFFAKDCHLSYVAANAAMLGLCGVRSRDELIGATAANFFPEQVRRRYEAADRQVLRTGKAVRDQLDYCVRIRGRPTWLLLSRWPILGDAQVEGVVAIARMLDSPDRRHPAYRCLSAVVEYLKENLASAPEISEAARIAGVPITRLERDFVRVFGVSPQRYLSKIRFDLALELLEAGGPIIEVAHACGYSDQSAFSRKFRSMVGVSPSEYRLSRFPDRQAARCVAK